MSEWYFFVKKLAKEFVWGARYDATNFLGDSSADVRGGGVPMQTDADTGCPKIQFFAAFFYGWPLTR